VLRFLAAIRKKKGQIDHAKQHIFAESNGHVVAQVLASQILEHQPSEKKINTISPVLEDREGRDHSSHHHGRISHPNKILVDDKSRDGKSNDTGNNYPSACRCRAASEVPPYRIESWIHGINNVFLESSNQDARLNSLQAPCTT
jgi:hypothetical protein